jgi:anti-anti-sigma factor
MTNERTIIVKELPHRLVVGVANILFRELGPILKTSRPRIVFDFSRVREIDSKGIGMLLRCAEEVIKRNGNLKFAAVPAEAAVMLELTGVDRLFESFDNVPYAVESFSPCSLSVLMPPWFAAAGSSSERTSPVEFAA